DPIGYQFLGMTLAERGELDEAKRLLERALERSPSDFDVLVALGRIAEQQQRIGEATALYERALQRQPDDRELLHALGSLALQQGANEAARAWFDQLLAQDWSDAGARAKVAVAYLKVGRLAEAAAHFRQAQSLQADEPTLPFLLGRVLEEMGDCES